MAKIVKLEPAEEKLEEPKPETKEENFFINIPEKEAQYTINQIIDICAIYQSTLSLPETTKIEKSATFHLEEIIKILMDHGIITQ